MRVLTAPEGKSPESGPERQPTHHSGRLADMRILGNPETAGKIFRHGTNDGSTLREPQAALQQWWRSRKRVSLRRSPFQYSLRNPATIFHASLFTAFCRFSLPFLVAASRCRFADLNLRMLCYWRIERFYSLFTANRSPEFALYLQGSTNPPVAVMVQADLRNSQCRFPGRQNHAKSWLTMSTSMPVD